MAVVAPISLVANAVITLDSPPPINPSSLRILFICPPPILEYLAVLKTVFALPPPILDTNALATFDPAGFLGWMELNPVPYS